MNYSPEKSRILQEFYAFGSGRTDVGFSTIHDERGASLRVPRELWEHVRSTTFQIPAILYFDVSLSFVTTCVMLGWLSCNNGRSTQPYVVGCLWPRGVCSYHWLALTRLRSLASPRLTYIKDVRVLSTNSRRMPGYNLETGLSSLPTLCDTCSWYSVVNLRPNLLEIQDQMCVLHSKDLW
jgi:hypothetical protein